MRARCHKRTCFQRCTRAERDVTKSHHQPPLSTRTQHRFHARDSLVTRHMSRDMDTGASDRCSHELQPPSAEWRSCTLAALLRLAPLRQQSLHEKQDCASAHRIFPPVHLGTLLSNGSMHLCEEKIQREVAPHGHPPKSSSGIRLARTRSRTWSTRAGSHMLHSPTPSDDDEDVSDASPSGRMHMMLPLRLLGHRKPRRLVGILSTRQHPTLRANYAFCCHPRAPHHPLVPQSSTQTHHHRDRIPRIRQHTLYAGNHTVELFFNSGSILVCGSRIDTRSATEGRGAVPSSPGCPNQPVSHYRSHRWGRGRSLSSSLPMFRRCQDHLRR